MLLLASLITLGYGQITVPGGKCVPVPLIADFDIVQYGGVWFDMLSYTRTSVPGRCIIATYELIDQITVSVNNSNVVPAENGEFSHEVLLGEAYQVEPETFPNKLYVSWYKDQKEASAKTGSARAEANYNVMDTDYENYAIIRGCRDNGFYTTETGSILSRNQAFQETEMFKEVVERAEKEFGFIPERANLISQDPTDCEYDFEGDQYPNEH